MNEKLTKLLEKIEDTPIKEKEIYEAIIKNHPKKSKAVKIALGRDDLSINDFTALEIAEFYNAMHKKITELKNEDGFFKKTQKTQNMELPSFEETEEIAEFMFKIDDAVKKEKTKKVVELSEDLEQFIFKIAKIDKEDLSDWEVELVRQQITSCSMDAAMTAIGKELKNL